jgi:hypothetical protein
MVENIQQILAPYPEIYNEFDGIVRKAWSLIADEDSENDVPRKKKKVVHQYPTRYTPSPMKTQEREIDENSSGSEARGNMDDERGFLTKLKYILRVGYDDLIKALYLFMEVSVKIGYHLTI